jgi:hypothetical protein
MNEGDAPFQIVTRMITAATVALVLLLLAAVVALGLVVTRAIPADLPLTQFAGYFGAAIVVYWFGFFTAACMQVAAKADEDSEREQIRRTGP